MDLGEAEFINDMEALPGELFAVLVISSKANASIKSVDDSEAMVSFLLL
jgi:xanthine dehydrogenase molybdopterin-binding subunit B